MQNPFLRLKHYRAGKSGNDAKENHATEVLGACLALSPRLRADFLNFLLGNPVPPVSLAEAADFTVVTQQSTDDGGWLDLLLERPGEEILVVEVKVAAPEDGPQIARYRKWLDGQPAAARKAVYSLVRSHDPQFRIEDHGGTGFRRWRGLHDHLQSRLPDYTDTVEEQLIRHLCNYLEAEQIVSTWTPHQILDYGPGVIAKRALRNLFQQIETRLADRKEDYETKVMCDNDAEWPRLGVGRQAWTSIFGTAGYHNKVSLYYQTKAAWQGGQECFCLEINLWHRAHACDWQVAKAKLPQWEAALRQAGYTVRAELRWGKPEERGADAMPFVEAPARVFAACWESPALGYVSEDDIKTMTDSELLDVLTDRVLRLCGSVSKLPG